jgi:hypothetical protein
MFDLGLRNFPRTGLVLSLAVVAIGCGDDDPPTGIENQAPTAQVTASPDSVPQGDGNQTVVTIDGSASSDPDGDTLSFSWVVPSGTFEAGTTGSDAVVQVTFPGAAPYEVTLTVSDGNGGSDAASVTIDIF